MVVGGMEGSNCKLEGKFCKGEFEVFEVLFPAVGEPSNGPNLSWEMGMLFCGMDGVWGKGLDRVSVKSSEDKEWNISKGVR